VTEGSLEPVYPDDAGAVDAAENWVAGQVACEGGAPGAAGALFGVTSLADDLCGADGAIETGAVARIDPSGAPRDLVAAYGAGVTDWVRTVPVASPVPMDLLLAPVDGQWVVVGTTSPGATS
jgi:hypothetical protein